MIKKLTYLLLFFIPIICSSQVNYNFESGNLAGWTQVPDSRWAASASAPLSGSYSLRQSYNNATDATDRISIALPNWAANSGTISWQVKVRHGYDPSASNHWWIYLMASQDANQMQLGSSCSGYAIGVNLTGSDDLLKLWRISNGVPQAILSSTLNWQTQIGRLSSGAIEVERTASGAFTLKASTSGSFSDLTNYGSITDNNFSDFSYFGICYSYTSSADLLLWVDDISINFIPANNNDLTSEVINPPNQVNAGSIMSNFSSPSKSVDVFKFQVRDNSTTDILPTRIKKLIFKKASSLNSMDWINNIGGVRLRYSNSEIPILNQTIGADKICLEVDSSTFVVPNGETKEYTLSLFLKSVNLIDGSTFRVMVDSIQHGFEAGVSGSGFSNSFYRKVESNTFTIGVDASNLKFLQTPSNVSKNNPFALSVAGVDLNGNVDKDFINPITIALSQGNGVLSSATGLTKNASLGAVIWNDLNYSTRGSFRIFANSAGFPNVESEEIIVLNDTTSTINQPTSQPLGTVISSLSCYPAKAAEVLRFTVYDQGNSDGVPTIVRSIKISRVETPDAASLSKSIDGVLMMVDGKLISISQPDIKTNYFTFTIENLTVPDGEFKDVNIFIYLKNQGLIDNQKIQLKIDAVNHGCLADPEGSTFKSIFPQQIISNIFSIDVAATKLKFGSIPTRVGVLLPFTVVLNAADLNGNVDKDFSGKTNLSLYTGNGELDIPSGLSVSMVSGSCSYKNMTYSTPEQFSLIATSSALTSVSSPLITCGDADGGILPESTQQNLVLVKSTVAAADSAVEVFKLNLFDAGSSDGLPLNITKISMHCFDPTKVELLKKQIAGFVIAADSFKVDVENYDINDGVFEIYPKVGTLVVPDGDTIPLAISVYLTKGAAVDNFPFQFYVPAANHGWESTSTGTGFANTFNSSIYGPQCIINVDAISLRFLETPFAVAPLQEFGVKVSAVDAFGSVDNNFNGKVDLSLEYGHGTFTTSNRNQNFTSGFALWNDVELENVGSYRFKASSEQLGSVISNEMYCGLDHNCIVQANFEGDLSPNWLGDDWLLSALSPINGLKSLQHRQNSNSGSSILAIPVDFPLMGDKLLEWNFTIRNGNWSPSSDNNFYFALMANISGLISDSISGFFIGINPSANNNFITLWRVDKSKKTSLITTNYNWGANELVTIRVGLTSKGDWKLWYQPGNTHQFIFGGEAKSIAEYQSSWCGLVFNYTSSRSGQLWFDDLSICSVDYPPVLLAVKPLNLNTVKIQFSESINKVAGPAKSNYSIIDSNNNNIGITSAVMLSNVETSASLNEAILKTDKLPFGKLLLKVDGIKGINGSSIKDSIYFGLGEQGIYGRLIINEIMASPLPSQGLPEYEYIELYNPTSDTILLNGWRLYLNCYVVNLPPDSILPKQYVVLCSTSAVSAMSTYGKSLGVTSFPALLNSGMSLKLFDPKGSLISMVNYSDSWYGDEQKKTGGWSLERIDWQNLMEGRNNWKASNSLAGGTPCSENSVAGENSDITPPRVLFFEITTDSTMLIQFTEPMDSLMITYTNSYNIDNNVGHPKSASLVGDDYSKVMLTLAEPISIEIIYNLCFSDEITDFSGNRLTADCIPYTLPQYPLWNDIVINEILFNPNVGGVDFVEIYNRSNKTFDLSKLSLSNRNIENQLDQINCITDTSRLLFPQSYGVVTTNPDLVRKFYHVENEKAFSTATNMASFNNDAGSVVLLGNNLESIDELHYTEGMHSKLLNDFKGVSLERINPDFESASSSTWHSASQTVGFATPTYKNSQWVETTPKDDEFSLSPEIFSPDGDGRDDYLLINYSLPTEGSVANIRVFNSNGREVKRLASNLLLGTHGTITWDGLNNNDKRVPIGIYIVYIEYFNPNGEVKKFKKTCVVAEKI